MGKKQGSLQVPDRTPDTCVIAKYKAGRKVVICAIIGLIIISNCTCPGLPHLSRNLVLHVLRRKQRYSEVKGDHENQT